MDKAHHGLGVGRALIGACADRARKHKLKGLVAETQDSNPSACTYGFILGGVDKLLNTAILAQTGNRPVRQDIALFFYLSFNRD